MFKTLINTIVRLLTIIAPLGADLGHPADAACHRRPHPRLHGRRGRDQPDPVGGHAARLDRSVLWLIRGRGGHFVRFGTQSFLQYFKMGSLYNFSRFKGRFVRIFLLLYVLDW